LAGDCGRGRAFGPREKEGVRPINRFLENAMMRREAALALQCTKRTKRVGGSQKGPRGPPGEGEVSLAKMAKVIQRCDKSEDVSTAGLAECVRAEGEASRAGMWERCRKQRQMRPFSAAFPRLIDIPAW
jgi:hypothetical protein